MAYLVICSKLDKFVIFILFCLICVYWVGSNRSIVTLALTFLTSSQAILIVWSKRAGKYEYSVTTANFSVREAEEVRFQITLQSFYDFLCDLKWVVFWELGGGFEVCLVTSCFGTNLEQ